jgi:hypothetical protein
MLSCKSVVEEEEISGSVCVKFEMTVKYLSGDVKAEFQVHKLQERSKMRQIFDCFIS